VRPEQVHRRLEGVAVFRSDGLYGAGVRSRHLFRRSKRRHV